VQEAPLAVMRGREPGDGLGVGGEWLDPCAHASNLPVLPSGHKVVRRVQCPVLVLIEPLSTGVEPTPAGQDHGPEAAATEPHLGSKALRTGIGVEGSAAENTGCRDDREKAPASVPRPRAGSLDLAGGRPGTGS
jgi:hypothetical protein